MFQLIDRIHGGQKVKSHTSCHLWLSSKRPAECHSIKSDALFSNFIKTVSIHIVFASRVHLSTSHYCTGMHIRFEGSNNIETIDSLPIFILFTVKCTVNCRKCSLNSKSNRKRLFATCEAFAPDNRTILSRRRIFRVNFNFDRHSKYVRKFERRNAQILREKYHEMWIPKRAESK